MIELTPQFASTLLIAKGLCAPGERIEAHVLAGGVSSNVLLVEAPGTDRRWVLKQPCPQLKVQDEWLCSVERVWREVAALRLCHALLEATSSPQHQHDEDSYVARVPQILFEDRENCLYAMTAAQPDSQPWKTLLLKGEADFAAAAACGNLLARLHGGSWQDADVAQRFGDTTFFDELRLDPYYRQIARVHEDLQPPIYDILASVTDHRRCLVHGDFSPKNLLVAPGEVMLIDFEVGHYGDPAFDLGFFLTHLVCKAIHLRENGRLMLRSADAFWEAYFQTLQGMVADTHDLRSLRARAMLHLAACLLARVDGKSPVDYLTASEQLAVRSFARAALRDCPGDWPVLRGAIPGAKVRQSEPGK